jgi:hypothetical protein
VYRYEDAIYNADKPTSDPLSNCSGDLDGMRFEWNGPGGRWWLAPERATRLGWEQTQAPTVWALSVTRAGAGTGNVMSLPAGIDCGTACTAYFVDGEPVKLFAASTGGSLFDSWSGACAGRAPCQVSMTAQRSVTAGFVTGCTVAPFSDVASSHPFCGEIKWMKDEAISAGFGDGTYRPGQVVTRQAMSAFMARLAGATLTDCTVAPFSDVPVDHTFCREIKWMRDEGISTGFGDGTYRPSVAVTRQAMSAFMARLAGATLPATCAASPFSDVPTSHPFCREITWMRENGISLGFADGTYRPSADVTRQAMSAFMFRLHALLLT